MERNPRILVVDDDEGSRRALSTLILDEGYAVETARNGADALQCIDVQEIDLVVSDVQMPGVGGFEVVRRLRRNWKSRDLPVILVSGQAHPDRRCKGHHHGADDFMVKPLDFDVLLARIQTRLRDSQQHREQRPAFDHDPLARILNPRDIMEVLAAVLKDAQKDESFTSVLMIAPTDGKEGKGSRGKKVNDTRDTKITGTRGEMIAPTDGKEGKGTMGEKGNGTRVPDAADDVVRSVAEDLHSSLRFADSVGHLGGGKFLVVLANTNLKDAQRLAQRLRDSASIASLAIGVASSQAAVPLELLMQRANKDMY